MDYQSYFFWSYFNWHICCHIIIYIKEGKLESAQDEIIYYGNYNQICLFIYLQEKPLEPGLMSLPLFYAFTIFINVFSIAHDGPECN